MKTIYKTIRLLLGLMNLNLTTKTGYSRLLSKHQDNISKALFYYKFYLYHNLQMLNDNEFLQYLELKYGGYVSDVVPTIDKSTVSKLVGRNHVGGDRMNIFYHDYSNKYSVYLEPLRKNNHRVLFLEIGILNGTGLAIWDEYFQNLELYGFDYDIGNFEKNKNNLIYLGAFKEGLPTVKFYDQFTNNSKFLLEVFGEKKITVVVDDANHSDKAVINSFNELQPFLANDFVYFIEDNCNAWRKLKSIYPNYKFDFDGISLTVVTGNLVIGNTV